MRRRTSFSPTEKPKGTGPCRAGSRGRNYDPLEDTARGNLTKDRNAERIRQAERFFKAALDGNIPIVKMLVSAGFDALTKDVAGRTARQAAIEMGRPHTRGVIKLLGGEELVAYASTGNLYGVRSLFGSMKCPVDVNHRNRHGKTALMYAAILGEVEIAKFLRNMGANKDIRDNDGKTATQYAMAALSEGPGYVEIVDLLEGGA